MSRINVLVASTSVDTKAEIIAERVAARLDMNLVGGRFMDVGGVDRFLEAEPRPEQIAIILLGKPADTREIAERWTAKQRGIVVMLVDLVDDVIRILGLTLRDPRLDALLTALREIVERVEQDAGPRVVRVDVGASSPRGERAAPGTEAAEVGDLLRKAIAWIDAVLLRYHQQHQPSGGDLPGLTRSHASVDTALSTRVVQPPSPATETSDDVDVAERELKAALAAHPADPLAKLHRRLHLTFLEFRAALLCLAPEIDARYQSVYGVLNDDLTRRTVTLGLACAVLGDPATVRYDLTQSAALTRWALTDHGLAFDYAEQPLRLDRPLAAWLIGDPDALREDHRLAAVTRSAPWPGGKWIAAALGPDVVSNLVNALEAPEDQRWIVLEDGDLDTSRAALEAASIEIGRQLIRLSLPGVARADAADNREVAVRAARAVQLTGAILAIDAAEAAAPEAVAALAFWMQAFAATNAVGALVTADVQPVVSVVGEEYVRVVRRDPNDSATAAAMLAAASAAEGLRISGEDASRLAMSFPLSLGGIDRGVRLAVLEGAGELEESQQPAALGAALRRVASPDLPRFARAVEPTFDLDDVVLPDDRRQQLREMVAHVRHAYQVLYTWGFREQLTYGRGVTALFSGPSGTGKTMAAQAIAGELGTRAYLVDLSRVVSKYIGETEKQLDAVFDDAERAGAVLLFDEADALFGKRSEIKDSHDRYANIEVAYLLQRMEAFSGLAILTTNLRRNMDEAFLRRLRFVVEFPRPDAPAREAIWHFCLPDEAPLAGDVNLHLLARRLELTGGSIRQITIRAAFAAAAERSPVIAMRHLIAAARAELLKLGLTSAERDLADLEAAASSRVA